MLAQVLPGDKAQEVEKRQQDHKVAMVGDGINVAPALAQANIGIAVGTGTAVAKETKMSFGTERSLRSLPRIEIARAPLCKVYRNLFWAFIYNTLAILLRMGSLLPLNGLFVSPELVALLMIASSPSLMLSATTLRWFTSTLQRERLLANSIEAWRSLASSPAGDESGTAQRRNGWIQ